MSNIFQQLWLFPHCSLLLDFWHLTNKF